METFSEHITFFQKTSFQEANNKLIQLPKNYIAVTLTSVNFQFTTLACASKLKYISSSAITFAGKISWNVFLSTLAGFVF